MKKLISVLNGIDAISEWTGKACAMLLFPLAGGMFYSVIMRYFFNAPPIWSFDISVFLYGGMSILAGAYALRHRTHVRVDIIYERFSPRTQAILDVITAGVFFLLMVFVVQQAFEMALYAWQFNEHTKTTWAAVTYPVKGVAFIAAILLLLQGLAKFIRDLFFAVTGRRLS
jgi:TRAP-type mannitol/chloroaromatic compound transport system permease small subunit